MRDVDPSSSLPRLSHHADAARCVSQHPTVGVWVVSQSLFLRTIHCKRPCVKSHPISCCVFGIKDLRANASVILPDVGEFPSPEATPFAFLLAKHESAGLPVGCLGKLPRLSAWQVRRGVSKHFEFSLPL